MKIKLHCFSRRRLGAESHDSGGGRIRGCPLLRNIGWRIAAVCIMLIAILANPQGAQSQTWVEESGEFDFGEDVTTFQKNSGRVSYYERHVYILGLKDNITEDPLFSIIPIEDTESAVINTFNPDFDYYIYNRYTDRRVQIVSGESYEGIVTSGLDDNFYFDIRVTPKKEGLYASMLGRNIEAVYTKAGAGAIMIRETISVPNVSIAWTQYDGEFIDDNYRINANLNIISTGGGNVANFQIAESSFTLNDVEVYSNKTPMDFVESGTLFSINIKHDAIPNLETSSEKRVNGSLKLVPRNAVNETQYVIDTPPTNWPMNEKNLTLAPPTDGSVEYDYFNFKSTLRWKVDNSLPFPQSAEIRIRRINLTKTEINGKVAVPDTMIRISSYFVDVVNTFEDDLSKYPAGFKDDIRYVIDRGLNGWSNVTLEQHVANTHVSPDTIWAEIPADTTEVVHVYWNDDDVIWTEGTTCTLTQMNRTTNTQVVYELTEEEYRKKSYVDAMVKPCNEYLYRIEITPGDSQYKKERYVQSEKAATPFEPGYIEQMTASKGYFSGRTEISWHSASAFDNFIVMRKPYGADDSEYKQIGSVTHEQSLTDYTYDDTKGTVGTVYMYKVKGIIKCGEELMESANAMEAVGFRTSVGTISGRVTYESGQEVVGVEVLTEADGASRGYSAKLDGEMWSGLISNKEIELPVEGFTVQAWINPKNEKSGSYPIIDVGSRNILEYSTTSGFTLLGSANGGPGVTADIENGKYSHASLVYGKNDSGSAVLTLYIDGKQVMQVPGMMTEPIKGLLRVAYANASEGFKGYVDEVRIWNRALTADEIVRDYTRQLYGGETGLITYYRFNEGVEGEVYDMSYEGDTYHQNDAVATGMAYTDDEREMPTNEQLAVKGITDKNGNYTINGVPFSQNGTQYRVIPRYGTHQFDPSEKLINMSENSSNFTCDFTDNSAFTLSGYVRYRNSTVPVKDVQFTIDGLPASLNNRPVMTGADGYYEISVPVGVHEVIAVKEGHVFENGGRLTDLEGNDRNYTEDTRGDFVDNTTVKFIGRVAGGPVQESFPIGHSASKNNLGEKLAVELALSNDAYKLTAGNDSTVVETHFTPTFQTPEYGVSDYVANTNEVVYTANKITVYPNVKTGEFVVNLIPEAFKVVKAAVKIENPLPDAEVQSDIVITSGEELNLTNSTQLQDMVYEYTKDIQVKVDGIPQYNPDGTPITEPVEFSDTVKYNAKAQYILRNRPTMSMKAFNKSGKEQGFDGDSIYVARNLAGEETSVKVYDPESGYLFRDEAGTGYPVMQTGSVYYYGVNVFEEYKYYKTDGSYEQTDKVPVTDGKVSVSNSIAGKVEPDELTVDNTGFALYKFKAGAPNLSSGEALPTLRMEGAVKIGALSYECPDMVNAIVVGGGSSGSNDIVTAGPDIVTTVLRDPPGSLSYSYLESGTAVENTVMLSNVSSTSSEVSMDVRLGCNVTTVMGLGVATEVEVEAGVSNNLTAIDESVDETTNSRTTRTEFTSRWETSADPAYVGANADLYIGKSTNIITSPQHSVDIIPDEDFNPAMGGTKFTTNSGFSLIRQESIGTGLQFKTIFAYPQYHIENILIPKLQSLIAQNLLPSTKTDAEAKEIANAQRKTVYISNVAEDAPEYGQRNSYRRIVPDNAKPEELTDTILTLIQSIENWQNAIANNERAKIEAEDADNISFQGGGKAERSMAFQSSDANTYHYEFVTGVNNATEMTALVNNIGMVSTITIDSRTTTVNETSSTGEATKTFGFVLEEEGTDYLSVDVKKVNNDNKFNDIIDSGNAGANFDELIGGIKGAQQEYVFVTRGGATSCPWEDGYTSQYYRKGTIIDQPTMQVEKPRLDVENALVTNVPSSRKAVFKLLLRNESVTNDHAYYTLSVIDASNKDGATFQIDGASLGNGRTFLVPAGETLEKTLEVGRGTAMDYENLQLVLHSQCQYDPTGYQDQIADTVSISVNFIPSSTDVLIAKPANNWVVNTNSMDGDKYVLPITLNGYDVNFENFHHIDLRYKPSAKSDDSWITFARFFKDQSGMDADQSTVDKAVITASEINYQFDMTALLDQQYDISAMSVGDLGGGQTVETVSAITSGIKDTYRPTLFGSPQPADGILGVEDEIRLNFNEEIAAGYLTVDKVTATGVRNGTASSTSTAVGFDGVGGYLQTELTRNFSGKDFTVETNLYRDDNKAATVFATGDENESFEFGFDASGRLVVDVNGTKVTSEDPIDFKEGEWEHVAVVFQNGDNPSLTAFYNYVEVISNAVVPSFSGIGTYTVGRSVAGDNYFHGKMNELRIWDEAKSLGTLNKNKGILLSGTEVGLMSYYPMNEGKGSVVEDIAGGNNAGLHGTWYIANPGKSVKFDGNSYLKVPTANAPVLNDMDYTLEFWFKSQAGSGVQTLVANGRGDGSDLGGSENKLFVGFDGNELVTRNNSYTNTINEDFRDNKWHHYALTVSRSMGRANIYVDGALKSWFEADNLGGMSADNMMIGVCNWTEDDGMDGVGINKTDYYYSGLIDEFRLWNLNKNATLVEQQSNVRLEGNEVGLLVYLPFEKFLPNAGTMEMAFTADNQVKDTQDGATEILGATGDDDAAGIKEVTTETSIDVEAVVNGDALIINPRSANAWNDFEQRIVTFTVKEVQDMNGNTSVGAITWTAFIDRNSIKWSESNISVEGQVYDGIDFTADVINIGGANQSFSIANLPTWLEADNASGSIEPKATQTVRFHVSESLGVGTYDQIIYLLNENGVARQLKLTVKVNGEKPDWSVNPADFRYNMTVYGKLRVNNIFSTDEEDMLAVFNNGKCVGVASNSYVKDYDMWYTFLTVYGNEPESDNLEFRIWDASTGKIFSGIPETAISFKSDDVKGSPIAPVIFDAKELQIQNIGLKSGWNWISFNVENARLSDISYVLGNNQWGGNDVVKSDATEVFANYVPEETRWAGTMATAGNGFNNRNMFLIKSETAQTLSLAGTPVTDKDKLTLDIKQGWNYISYLPSTNLSLKDALAGYDAKEGDIIKDAEQFAMYSENVGWLGSMTYMKPGNGYMLNRVSGDAELTYPSTTVNRSQVMMAAAADVAPANATATEYPENMSVIATVGGALTFSAGDRLLAYSGDELRGEAVVIEGVDSEPLCFMSIAGEQEDALMFVLERDGEVAGRAVPQFGYKSNSVKGTVEKPYEINFGLLGENAVYPTVFDSELNVSLSVAPNADVNISMYDISGRRIRTFEKPDTRTGAVVMTLDALDNLIEGMYIVNVEVDGITTSYKVRKR